ncbi:GyrI-like domain-containing protein [Microbispora rosea]|uniref:GyrI-like domain-containing protein n=1 Tax=Microbispora rosea TaxID=58117 RepID=UPI00068B5004|nr:GyrI-like domain-containing protein [Microbispora rosea]
MNWYSAADTPELADFGPVTGLGVTGRGAPGGPAHMAAITALYAVAGPLTELAALPMPVLEGRWWVEDTTRHPLDVPRGEWHWHLFLRLPTTLDPALAEQAREAARPAPSVDAVQLVTFTDGRCVQMTHHGSFAEEPKSLALMDEFMRAHGLRPAGLHHEIYLSGVQESDPADLRTILRQPVRHA